MKSKLRRALLDRQVTCRIWIQIDDPAVAELCVRAGNAQGGRAMI